MDRKVKLKLKPEFKGSIVKRQVPRMGEMEFNTELVDPAEYPTYAACGFADLFEEETLTPVEQVKTAPAVPKVEEDENENEDEDEDTDDEDELNLDLTKDEEDEENENDEENEADVDTDGEAEKRFKNRVDQLLAAGFERVNDDFTNKGRVISVENVYSLEDEEFNKLVAEEAQQEQQTEAPELDKLKVTELQARLEALGIPYGSKETKASLLNKLQIANS